MAASYDSQWLLDGLEGATIRRPQNGVHVLFITVKAKWSPFYLRHMFKCIFLNGEFRILIEISLNFVARGLTDDITLTS